MYIENNPLRLVRIGDMYGKVLEDVTTKVKDITGAYVGESFILTTSDEVCDKVFDVIENTIIITITDNKILFKFFIRFSPLHYT